MKLLYKFLLFILLFTGFETFSFAGLPQLPIAPEITTGKLANGISYYLVQNKAVVGLADFAIARKASEDSVARESLRSLPHFTDKTPYEFLASKGIIYSRDGYVRAGKDCSFFHFENVPVTKGEVTDSLLMMVFDIIATSQAEQALIISGDINKKNILDRMQLFSMMVPPRKQINDNTEYKWTPSKRIVECEQTGSEGVSSLELEYCSPRTPKEYLNTAQPLVTSMFASFFGKVVESRLYKALRDQNIPVANIDFQYKSSAEGPGDESYSLKIVTDDKSSISVAASLAKVLASMDRKGATIEEYKDAKDEYISEIKRTYGQLHISNKQYINICGSSFLFGSSMASVKKTAEFFLGRDMPASTELKLFNRFVIALLDNEENIRLKLTSNACDKLTMPLEVIFDAVWKTQKKSDLPVLHQACYGDTLSLPKRQKKVKIKSERTEPISGGQLWTFANGMTVVFKHLPMSGSFDYALMLRGGAATIPSMQKGESAFIADMLSLYDVSGLRYYDFANMLRANGITMNNTVGVSDMRLTGRAPSIKLQLLLRSFLAIANERTLNVAAYEYYRKNETLRLKAGMSSFYSRAAAMDSILCSDYIYSPYKTTVGLSDDLPFKAEYYYNRQFSRFNDCVLMIMGDLDEQRLKSLLCRYLGGLKTQDTVLPRPNFSYTPNAGASTYVFNGSSPSVNLLLSSPVRYTADNFMAVKIAMCVLRKYLAEAFVKTGMSFSIYDKFDMLPEDRLTLRLFADPVNEEGLPAGIKLEDPISVLFKIRTALNVAASREISEEELKNYKNFVKNYIETNIDCPQMLMSAVLTKYSDGKDLLGRYSDKLNRVTSARVKQILEELNNGGRIEMIIR